MVGVARQDHDLGLGPHLDDMPQGVSPGWVAVAIEKKHRRRRLDGLIETRCGNHFHAVRSQRGANPLQIFQIHEKGRGDHAVLKSF
jgi:hypothetical protein